MPVLGFGGYFFRARDPAALEVWYRRHLGVGAGLVRGQAISDPGSEWVWQAEGGPVVFQPFKADSDYFTADRSAMINLRVSDLDGLLASLRTAGIAVEREETMDGVGRFARVHDPEGNPVELWEQPAAET
ncbi:VOC family protein [Croceibacterium ferulae]|uniref:VOC family protein n=1 Tax=Croceibacterium ferulae TaxID=1854641 RepID=UPI000EB59443|nr:VOC family protein [Croceibacterium ferulae]